MSVDETWNEWRVVITATQEFATVLRSESQGPPLVGPEGEPIDEAKSRIVEVRNENRVVISEMETATNTYYMVKGVKIECPPDTTTTETITFDADVNIMSATTTLNSTHTDDVMDWVVRPNTTIGVLGSDTGNGASTLVGDATTIQGAQPLFRLRLTNTGDPSDFEDLGVITDIDEATSTLTFNGSTSKVWPAGTTYVQVTAVYVDNIVLSDVGKMSIGKEKIGASFIPKGGEIVCRYENKSADEAKQVYVYLSIMYGILK